MEKIKLTVLNWIESEKGKDIMVVIIVILVGLGAFELGRLSKGTGSTGIKIQYPDGTTVPVANAISSINSTKKATAASNSAGKTFFASSRGTKYYSLGCSGGKTIKQENRVYFSTKEEAEKAGYELSTSCK